MEYSMMKFSEYLANLPSSIVFEGILKNSGQPRKILTSSMVNEIAGQFSAEENLARRFSGLSDEAGFLCSLTYLFLRTGLAFDKAPRSAAPGESDYVPVQVRPGEEPGDAIPNVFDDELIRSFLVYAGYDEQGHMYYLGFEEFEHKLRKLCGQTIINRTRVLAEKEPLYSQPPAFFLNDVTVIGALASQGKLKKTKTGALGKTALQSVNKLLHYAHFHFEAPGPNEPAALLPLSYGVNRKLLRAKEDGYAVSHTDMLAWLSKPFLSRYNDFIEFVGSSVLVWRKSLLMDILHRPGRPWLSSQGFGEKLRPDVCAAIKMLAYCGLVDFFQSADSFVFTRSAQSAASQDAFSKALHATQVLLMPDFTAMIPQEILPEHLYWFSKLGSLVSFDRVYKGAISRDIINNSLSEGIAGDVLLDWLARWKAPKNVVETIKEWVREFSRISLETGSFVVSAEEKVTTQLMSYAPLMQCLEPVRAHTIFRVAAGRERQVSEILVAMGFDQRTPVFSKDDDTTVESSIYLKETKSQKKMYPILDATVPQGSVQIAVTQGKYSSQLKALDLTDLMHVIDYALLMGHFLQFEYSGSPYIKKGKYQARPLHYKKGPEPLLEAEITGTKKKKTFLINRIIKIGVEHADV